jgi:hypothetical protein
MAHFNHEDLDTNERYLRAQAYGPDGLACTDGTLGPVIMQSRTKRIRVPRYPTLADLTHCTQCNVETQVAVTHVAAGNAWEGLLPVDGVYCGQVCYQEAVEEARMANIEGLLADICPACDGEIDSRIGLKWRSTPVCSVACGDQLMEEQLQISEREDKHYRALRDYQPDMDRDETMSYLYPRP